MAKLTEIPKVGDKVKYVGDEKSYLTQGKVYTIQGVDIDNDVFFFDDNGTEEYLTDYKLNMYEEAEADFDNPGYIRIIAISHNSHGNVTLEVDTDEQGLESIKALESSHEKSLRAAVIVRQIDELQKELKNL